jgi:uncharacterized protein (UPF0261 family)
VGGKLPTVTVALLGTLDTKGTEYQWVADQLSTYGVRTVVIDAGVAGPRGFTGTIDHPHDKVAELAGSDIGVLRSRNDRGFAIATMAEGAAIALATLVAGDGIDGAMALGGSGGSAIAARAMRDLPVGLPKLIVSTMAAGDVSAYVGSNDVTLMYSVVDVAGINRISRAVLGNAAAAMAAMAGAQSGRRANPSTDDRPLIGASMFGVTTPAVDAARARFEELGYEVVTFHATGAGGRALEALARSGFFAGVFDLTTTELADDLVGGVLSAGPDRLTGAGAAGVPQVVSLGALDMVNFGPEATVPPKFAGRRFYVHNPTVTLMRTTAAESEELGRRLGTKLAAATAPTVLVIPRGGVSALDAVGQPFWDEEADAKLFNAVSEAVAGTAVEVLDDPANINDAALARRAADQLHRLIEHDRLIERAG